MPKPTAEPLSKTHSRWPKFWKIFFVVFITVGIFGVLVFVGWWASNPSNESAVLDWVLIDNPFFSNRVLLGALTLATATVAFALLVLGESQRTKAVRELGGVILGLLAATGLTMVVIQSLGYDDPTKGWSEVELAVLDEMYQLDPGLEYYDPDLILSHAWEACAFGETYPSDSEALVAKVVQISIDDQAKGNVYRNAIDAVASVGVGNEANMGLCWGNTSAQSTVQGASGWMSLYTEAELREQYG